MATGEPNVIDFLYLDQITLEDVPRSKYKLELFVENEEIELQRKDNQTWAPAQRPDIFSTSQLRVEIQIKSGHGPWAKNEQISKVIGLQKLFIDSGTPEAHELVVTEVVVVGKHYSSLELQFSAKTTAESLRSSLHELEELLRKYSPLMNKSTERALEKIIECGAVIAESNDIAKAVFSVAQVTFGLLKEQNKYDQMPSDLFDRLQRILPLVDKVTDEIMCRDTEILKKVIPRMSEVMNTTVKVSCDYIKRGRFERTKIGLINSEVKEMIEDMDGELAKVIEDFMRAIDVEALYLAKMSEQELLLGRLKTVEAGHDLDAGCMEGTRQSILTQIMAWVTNPLEGCDASRRHTYWLYGSPGIGKTSLAHSICEKLHDQNYLAGAFFCRRDDPNLNEPRNVLPSLVNKLAGMFPPFRSIVAEHLRNDPNLTSKSMKYSLFLDFIHNLPRNPKHALIFVIDALDECGDYQSRQVLLRVLTDAATHVPWLKIIVTSRPEVDIQTFFKSLALSTHLQCDLAADEEATSDIRIFAQDRFSRVALKRHLQSPWPERSLFDGVISRAAGLFIFIKTVALALERCEDPTEFLKATLQDSTSTGLKSLYGLYSSILKARIVHSNAKFRQMIGVLLATAPYRPLCEETIAELAGVDPSYVKTWVDDLSSFLYRDDGANGGVRVRHLSISDFFVSDHCDYQVNLQDVNVQLGLACLKTMASQLCFNICKLEDSRLANADVKDLPSRIRQHISDPLQYSSLYWSNHICSIPDNGDWRVLGGLTEFFEGLYPLFWIEVLSILEVVPIAAPSLRRVVSWVKDADSTLLERIRDVCRFIITFHTPISISAPHTYISTQPFLPSQSPLSATFNSRFTRAIKVQRGKLLSWPTPPLEWLGHNDTVRCISYAPNGFRIATGSYDKTIRIWDAETGATVGEPLEGHTGFVWSIAHSPDGKHITSGSVDSTIRIWDAETGAAAGKPLTGHTGAVFSIAYSPDGRYIASGSIDMTIRIWDAETGADVGKPLEGHTGGVWSVAYSPDGLHITSGSIDKTIRIWNAETGATVGKPFEGHTGGVRSTAYSPNGRHIISGSDDKTVRIWDAKTGAVVGKPLEGHTKMVTSVAYSPGGRTIISGSDDKTIRIWDPETSDSIGKPLAGHTGGVGSIAYSPDGRHIISGSTDLTIRIWDANTGAAIGKPLEGRTEGVSSVAYSPDGQHVISGHHDGTVRIWDAETGAAVYKPLEGHTGSVWSVAYSPNGRHILAGSNGTTIIIWDAETGAAVGRPLMGHTGGVSTITCSPDGRHIISGSHDMTIRIWDAETGATVCEPLEGHTDSLLSVAHSPDGRHITSGSSDKTIRIWDADNGEMIGKPLEGHIGRVWSVAYSPDGRQIISGSDDMTIRTWDAETGAAVMKPLEGHTGVVRSVTYTPNGQHIVSGSNDMTIRIWDAKTGAAIGRPFNGHTRSVVSVASSPDGQRIVSGSRDNTVHFWNPHVSTQLSSFYKPNQSNLRAQPDPDGWVRDPEDGLLYWVPPDYRPGLHSPALLTIHLTSHIRSVSLDFADVAFGNSWAQIFKFA